MSVETITLNQFMSCISKCNQEIYEGVIKRVCKQTHLIKDPIHIYFWIRDDNEPLLDAEAIFAIPSFVRNETELGFITRDHTLFGL